MRGAHQQRQPEGAPPCAPAKAKQGPRRRHTVFFRSKTTAERRTRTRAMSVCSCFAGSATAQAGGLARRRHKSLQFFKIPARPGPTPNPDLIKMLGSCMFSHPVLPEIQDPCTFGPAIIRYKIGASFADLQTFKNRPCFADVQKLGVLNRGMPLHIPPKPVKPLQLWLIEEI